MSTSQCQTANHRRASGSAGKFTISAACTGVSPQQHHTLFDGAPEAQLAQFRFALGLKLSSRISSFELQIIIHLQQDSSASSSRSARQLRTTAQLFCQKHSQPLRRQHDCRKPYLDRHRCPNPVPVCEYYHTRTSTDASAFSRYQSPLSASIQHSMMDQGVKIEMPHVSNQDEGSEQRGPNEHVKRPMNAFMVWAKTERRQLAMRLPGIPNSEVSKLLGEMWRNLSDDEKNKYRSESETIRRKHKQEHPGYRYHPNRHSRKQQRLVDAGSPMATSLIQSSKHVQQQQQQQRSQTPTATNQRMITMKNDGRPHSAPPATMYPQDSMRAMTGGAGVQSLTSVPVSTWWSPASTPPTSTFPQQARALNPSLHTQFAQAINMPNSPSSVPTQDLSTGMSPQSSWMKQNSPADSHHSVGSSKQQRASPCLLDSRRQNQSPLIGSAGGNLLSSSLNNSSTSVGVATSGSLLPTMSTAFYDNKNPVSYMTTPEQASSMIPMRSGDFQRFPGLTQVGAAAAKPTAIPTQVSPNYDSSLQAVMGGGGVEQRNDSVLAPGTLFYPAYQPATYLSQPQYSWLDSRTTFVLPEQLAGTPAPHGQMYHQQSVAS